MEDRLRAILSSVNDWLRYAEVKNGALLTFASGAGFTLMKSYPRFLPGSKGEWYYLIAIALVSVSALSCLVSFIPRLKIPWFEAEKPPRDDDNLFFFGDIAKFSATGYVTALLIASGEPVRAVTNLETHLALQA